MLEGGEHAGSRDDAGEGEGGSFQRKKQKKMWGRG